ncbi:hypothetical protein [Bacillus sp. V5-8f]|nr:hypothetical protein [Bacillus sp. V5-8f]
MLFDDYLLDELPGRSFYTMMNLKELNKHHYKVRYRLYFSVITFSE